MDAHEHTPISYQDRIWKHRGKWTYLPPAEEGQCFLQYFLEILNLKMPLSVLCEFNPLFTWSWKVAISKDKIEFSQWLIHIYLIILFHYESCMYFKLWNLKKHDFISFFFLWPLKYKHVFDVTSENALTDADMNLLFLFSVLHIPVSVFIYGIMVKLSLNDKILDLNIFITLSYKYSLLIGYNLVFYIVLLWHNIIICQKSFFPSSSVLSLLP